MGVDRRILFRGATSEVFQQVAFGMGKRYDHLTAEDRKLIARLRDDGIPVTVMA